jgi:magnesium chelatase family protein
MARTQLLAITLFLRVPFSAIHLAGKPWHTPPCEVITSSGTPPFMTARVATVAFSGIDVLDIDVQVQLAGGVPTFTVVGLPDKAVGESRERVRAALHALGLSLPAKRITVNLAPADVMKEGSHFDLPIALALLVAMGVLPAEDMAGYYALGELALDGGLAPVTGILPAAMRAAERDRGLICPAACGAEAAWAANEQGRIAVLAPATLLALINHVKGLQILPVPEQRLQPPVPDGLDLRDIKGQETAKRALEVAAAGGHNLLMIGPPGSGKSMLARRLPGLLPPLQPREALDLSMIYSISGLLEDGALLRQRPFRDPHHSASLPALVGGGSRARPGEISLAHLGVLFLDELPEFSRQALESLRQPLETGRAVVSRANHHAVYPAQVQLVAAMNPCRCGFLGDVERACSRAPRCGADYQARLSGPLLDRIDLTIDVPAVSAADLAMPPAAEGSHAVAERVGQARAAQAERFAESGSAVAVNAQAEGKLLEHISNLDTAAANLLAQATDKMKLSARSYHRVLKVSRTLADLDGAETVRRAHVAEALSYRRVSLSH